MKNPTRFAWLFSCAMSTSGAQDVGNTDAAITRYREYRTALERNDLAAAETAAMAALQASEVSRGPRTAVLALNLAKLRLALDDPAHALEPAMRAYELAMSSSDAGVDPLHASLVLGRSQLAANDASGAERLRESIAAAELAGEPATEAYDAAVALGEWALQAEQSVLAQRAWASASRLVDDSSGDAGFSRGRARLLEGVAIYLGGVDTNVGSTLRRRPVDTLYTATAEAHEAYYAFSDAIDLLKP